MDFFEQHADKIVPVSESGCWIWIGAESSSGYGAVKYKGRMTGAHRAAFIEANDGTPKPDLVMHKCDIRCCVNPDHLCGGCHSENMADMVAKGRSATGENHSQSKLVSEEIIQIRQRYEQGETQSALAREFGVHKSTIWEIVNRKIWAHLDN